MKEECQKKNLNKYNKNTNNLIRKDLLKKVLRELCNIINKFQKNISNKNHNKNLDLILSYILYSVFKFLK